MDPVQPTEPAATSDAPPATEAGEEALTTEVAPEEVGDGFSAPLAVGGGLLGLVLLVVMLWSTFGRRPPPPIGEVPVEEVVEAPAPAEVVPEREEGLLERMRAALGRTRSAVRGRIDELFGGAEIDESVLEALEEALLLADVGVITTERLLQPLREAVRQGDTNPETLRASLQGEIRTLLDGLDAALDSRPASGPWVFLIVGVNGSGKTTTIGKLAARFHQQGKQVMLAAGDTHRAAAGDQLKVWAERAHADIVAHQPGGDPGAVVYDALQAALARGHDVVIVDTAGRLQTRKPLMEQLSKIRRVIGKLVPDGPHETLLVLDGTMGQNGLSQAQLFHEATPLTGVVVTKLDGTAKGGMILTIAAEMELPVKLVGIGEKLEDLADFDADAFAEALA
jgi:fused signal recognition particle receptor